MIVAFRYNLDKDGKTNTYTTHTLTIGSKQGRAKVMVNEAITTGWKFKILGYISKGDNVPEVITTL